jgi:hypothetical protein
MINVVKVVVEHGSPDVYAVSGIQKKSNDQTVDASNRHC